MKKILCYSILLIAVFFTAHLYGQIGTIIPENRLPIEVDGTLSWTLAGYEGNIPYAEETIDVTQSPYNAAGDGVTDDTQAIRNAIAAADTSIISEILFPEGTYLINAMELENNAALNLPKNIILKGVTAKDSDSNLSELKFLIGGDGHDPEVNYNPQCIRIEGADTLLIENVGIEDLTIKRYNTLTDAQNGYWFLYDVYEQYIKGRNILVEYAKNCWITGVESDYPLKYHIGVSYSDHIEITGCYIHDPQYVCGKGYGYGVCISNSNYCLVENNIFSKCRHAMILAGESFNNVCGYNYSRKPRQSDRNEVNKDFTGDICLHGNSGDPGSSERKPKYNLFEGNIVSQIKVDHVFKSNGKYNTFFRNRGYPYGIWLDRGGAGERNNHQTLVNNYVKCYRYFYCIAGLPRDFEPSHFFEKNTINKQVNFWGTPYKRIWSDDKVDKEYPSSWDNDISYYYEEPPEFMCFCEWPMHPKDDTNEAKRRWGLGGKLTWGRDDIYEFTTETWSGDIQIGGSGDVVIPAGYCVIISPGSTVEIDVFDKLVVKGCLIAEGTENDSILFTVKDYYPGMNTNCYGISFEMTVNPGESILKHCKFEHFMSCESPYDIDEFTPTTHGGALYVENYDNLTIDSCLFIDNTAYVGGAICLKNSDITIKNSKFIDNFGDCGGAIMSSASSPSIISNIIDNNCSVGGKGLLIQAGGGIYLDGSGNDNIYLTNNVISNNVAVDGGGIAICNCNDNVICMNNTITNNTVDYGGGGIWIDTSNDIFINNIFWNNAAYYGPQLRITSSDLATMSFYNCDIEGGIDGIDFAWVDFEGEAVDNIDSDPNFIGSGDHPYAITWNTECYNNGLTTDNPADSLLRNTLYTLPTKDPSGNPRTALDTIDVGAYEAYEPGMNIEDLEIGFGNVAIENPAIHTFEIMNESMSELLYIDSINVKTYIYVDSTKTEVSGFTVEDNAFILPPGYSLSRDITFSPELTFEDYYGEIIIYSSDPYFPKASIYLKGRGMPSNYQEIYGEISSDETWDGYIELTGDVTISNGATLTIAENSEVYDVEGYILTLESGTLTMDGANLYLKNSSEMHVYGDVTLSGRSLLEISSGSLLNFYEGSGLYGTEHTVYVDPATGSKYETWAEAYEINNEIGVEDAIPGDRVVVNDDAIFQALGKDDNPVTIASLGDGRWDGIEIYDSKAYISTKDYIFTRIEYGNISGISHIKTDSSSLALTNVNYSNCGQISSLNNSYLCITSCTFENISACPIYSCESALYIMASTIQNNEGKGLYLYLPSDSSSFIWADTIRSNSEWGVQIIDAPIFCGISTIMNNSSHGFVSYGAEGTPVLAGNTIANNEGMEIVGLYQWPDMVSLGGNTVYSQNNGGTDHYLLATTVQGSDCRGNDIDISDHTRFSPSFDYYIFDSEEPEEKIPYGAAIEDISEKDYESAKITMAEIVNVYPATETASDALQWLLYLENFSGNDYAGLRSFAESIDDVSYPNLERIKNKVITSTYMCEKDYLTSIDRLEDIIADPPSVEDSILALIHEGYCYLKLEEEGDKAVPAECSFKPHSFNEFKYVSQNLLDDVLSTLTFSVTNPQVEFALHQNYPNPVSHSTTFSFLIPADAKNAELKIYNIRGQLVKTFKSDTVKKGTDNKITWACKDDNGRTLCNGIYFYKLTADKKETVKKMVMIR